MKLDYQTSAGEPRPAKSVAASGCALVFVLGVLALTGLLCAASLLSKNWPAAIVTGVCAALSTWTVFGIISDLIRRR